MITVVKAEKITPKTPIYINVLGTFENESKAYAFMIEEFEREAGIKIGSSEYQISERANECGLCNYCLWIRNNRKDIAYNMFEL